MDKVLSIFKEGLVLWRTHLEKRKELYEVALSKKKNKALNYAESGFSVSEETFNYIYNTVPMSDSMKEDVDILHKEFKKIRKNFDKYD